MFKNPLYEWKNITENPNVTIRRDILKFGDKYAELRALIDTLHSKGKSLDKVISQIAELDIEIKKKEKQLKKAKAKKTEEKIKREAEQLLKKKESLARSHKGVESEFVKKAADSYVDFKDLIDTIYLLNIQPLTLMHRLRKHIDGLIDKVRALKHAEVGELERLKAESISHLNRAKQHLKEIADELYRSSEFQERSAFNPAELAKEWDLQTTLIKVKRVRRLTVAIDMVENDINKVSDNLTISSLPEFVDKYILLQAEHFRQLAHHIKVFTHRFHKILYHYPENKKLKKPFRRDLHRITKQTRLLWNDIHIKHYHVMLPKKQEIEQIKKAA